MSNVIKYITDYEINVQEVLKMLDRTKIEEVINRIRPLLQRDGGDVELVEVTDDDIVKVKLVGACGACPMSIMTLKGGIEAELKKHIPGIKAVMAV